MEHQCGSVRAQAFYVIVFLRSAEHGVCGIPFSVRHITSAAQ